MEEQFKGSCWCCRNKEWYEAFRAKYRWANHSGRSKSYYILLTYPEKYLCGECAFLGSRFDELSADEILWLIQDISRTLDDDVLYSLISYSRHRFTSPLETSFEKLMWIKRFPLDAWHADMSFTDAERTAIKQSIENRPDVFDELLQSLKEIDNERPHHD